MVYVAREPMERYQQNPVSEAIWPWARAPEAKPRREGPSPAGVVARFAVVSAVAALMIRWGHRVPAAVLFGLGVFILVSGFFLPRAFAAFERLVGLFARGVGLALTWLLLVPFFYLFFVPGRLILRLQGKDPLHRQFPSPEKTCWTPHHRIGGVEQYRKQYG